MSDIGNQFTVGDLLCCIQTVSLIIMGSVCFCGVTLYCADRIWSLLTQCQKQINWSLCK